jgi:probable HAF family extracellular repeat protein
MNTKKILLFSLCIPLPALADPQFTVTDLGPIQPGGALFWHADESQTENGWASLGGTPINNQVYQKFGGSGVGSSVVDPDGTQVHAAQWTDPNTVIDLGVLPNARGDVGTDGPQSVAYAMNSLGDVVGWSQTDQTAYFLSGSYFTSHAFLLSNGVMHDLGTLAILSSDPMISHGYSGANFFSYAEGVNDMDEVVGSSNAISSADGSVLQRAFYYANGTMYNLSFFLSGAPGNLRLTEAVSIDCQGNIAAIGADNHSYLLTRVGPPRNCAP